MIRLGIIGCGHIARLVHLPALARLAGCEVVAVADPDAENLARAGMLAPAARRYPGWEPLLAAGGLDGVVICAAPALNLPIASAALKTGLAVYLEKPLALGVADGKALVAAARGRTAQIGFNFRFNPAFEALRAQLHSGETGPVLAVRTRFTSARQSHAGWKTDPATGGGALSMLGSHHLDLLRWLFPGDPVATLHARERSLANSPDVAMLSGSLASGLGFQLLFAQRAGLNSNEIELVTQRGLYRASTSDPRPRPPETLAGQSRLERGRAALAGLDPRLLLRRPGFEPSFARAFAAFVAAASQKQPASPALADGLAALQLVEIARQSAATGKVWQR